ncbi:MAG: tRNA 2-thiouridine(34) synthase MnmA [Candidatus Paceibacterota bacterium]
MQHRSSQTAPHIYVALSGGVDSAVSAALLVKHGYRVTGAFIKTWQPAFLECQAPLDREDARRVAAHLGIPFTTIDLEDAYKHGVADQMIDEYRVGRTPNPDILCNQQVKFGAFLREALARGADGIATGHYARVQRTASDGTYTLLRGADKNKDQSYFLWTLGQKQLSQTLFPVGEYTKPDVRALAKEFGLSVAAKKDSQGVCFLGKLDMKEFLGHFIDTVPGDVLNLHGDTIGRHDGALFYTLGQRHGFVVTKKSPTTGPLYVVAKDCVKNTITVSEQEERTRADCTMTAHLTRTGWTRGNAVQGTFDVQFRYRQPTRRATIEPTKTGAVVTFTEPQLAVAPGQSLVVYDKTVCLGGGIIEQTSPSADTRPVLEVTATEVY